MNTVPSYDGETAATFVLMSRSLRSKPIVFVEGLCEVRLLSHVFPECEDQLIACEGHTGVKLAHKVIEKWKACNDGCIDAIFFIDRDYSDQSDHGDFLMSHHRDVEIDVYSTQASLRLLREKASKRKCSTPETVIDDILDAIKPLSILRYYNSKEDLKIPLNQVNLEKAIGTDSKIDSEKLVSIIAQKFCIDPKMVEDLSHKIKNPPRIDIRGYSRGHDVSLLLGKWLRKRLGNRKVNETDWKTIEENLRLAARACELDIYRWMNRISEHLTSSGRECPLARPSPAL